MSRTVDNAYDYIYSAIANGHLLPGAHIPEEMISARLAVSRTPVREAIRRLQADGLVVITPNSGADVAFFGPQEIAETFRLRALLEGQAAERAASRIAEADLAELDCSVKSLAKTSAAHDDVFEATRLNAAFHIKIAEAAESPRLLQLIRGLVRIPPALMHGGNWAERLLNAPGHDEHARIVAALRARNGALSRALMQAHILAAQPAFREDQG